MQITSCQVETNKYIQIYLTEEELNQPDTKELINKYKKQKCNVAIFITGNENYYKIINQIITNQLKSNKSVY